MPIIFHESSKTFHLYNDKISYIFCVLKSGHLGALYFGKRLHDRESFEHLLEYASRPMSPAFFEVDQTYSLEHLRQEYPSFGSGDMRSPAYELRQASGSTTTNFFYESFAVTPGKPKLPGLPATYTESDTEAETLTVTLRDDVAKTVLKLRYTIFAQYAAIARSAEFICENEDGVTLTEALSGCLDLPDADYEMIELTGAWSRERAVKTRKLAHGIQAVQSMRGNSSSQFNPFIALKRPNTDEFTGEAYGFSLIYSGNFLAQAEVDPYDVCRVTMGIHPRGFAWPLDKGESFTTPEAVLVYSETGLNGMSDTYHKLYRTRLARGKWRDEPRPILINNWEATYFDFNEEKILSLAKTAQSLGVELFVLDDGWFGKRNDDTCSLGDWNVNMEKLPHGIKGLGEQIEALGLKFGIWIEPEMVNKDSDLYRAHPDWLMCTPDRRPSQWRNQYVLDFSRKEVVDYIGDLLEKTFDGVPLSYVKWDMNRSASEVYSVALPPEQQGTVYHRYILGVYALYERLIARFPHILFESCSSGGGRFDPGMLYYAPQCWTSDDTDAIERLKIQYGTSFCYPVSSMGAHVSAVPNHQLGRITPLSTRADVAYFGTFGYELDLTALSQEELGLMKTQIAFMKEHRKLIQQGTFYRLSSPFEGNDTAWMVVSDDKKTALVGFYRVLQQANPGYKRLRLTGLDPDTCYHISLSGDALYGDELMQAGLVIPDTLEHEASGDFRSRVYLLKA